jgi:2-polyprenyl-6-hydroxyphenyl methylase/3-demethylubiquinone-9 3-methyltransferase
VKALALYRGLGAGVAFHTRVRAFTCPMAAVLARVPAEGRMLEVGCGHGLFSNEAALLHPKLHVLGVDPSEAKIRWAEKTAAGRENVAFRPQRVEDVPERAFDAVAVLDVLYLVPRGEWPGFLRACRERLRPGGRFLLKEVDVRPRWKFYRCLVQETMSVRMLGITLGHEFAFEPPSAMSALLEEAGFRGISVTPLGRGYLTPHVLYEATPA